MSPGLLRACLLIAGAGAVLALVDRFGTAGAVGGLALMLLGLLLSVRAASRRGPDGADWWALMAVGCAVAGAGVPLELLWETPGGLLTGLGSALVVVGVALGLP
jgi:hypothetical protein